MQELLQRYRETKIIELEAADKKVMHIEKRCEAEIVRKQAPEATKVLLDNVNVFNTDWSELGKEAQGSEISRNC